MHYNINFDLHIERIQDKGYKVTLLPLSEVEARLCDDILSAEMLADIERLEESFLDDNQNDEDDSPGGSGAQKPKKHPRIDESFLEAFGQKLFECLFRGDIRDAYYEAYGSVANSEDKGLRIRLMIDPPEIAVLPWELMFKKKKRRFLSTWEKVSVTRYLNLSPKFGEFDVKKPMGVLVAIPEGSGLDVEKEKELVREAFKELTDENEIRLDFVEGYVSDKKILRQLDDGKPYHVFHFIGHGCFDGDNQDEGYVRLNPEPNTSSQENDRKGKWEKKGWLRADAFADLFANHPSMQLIVLNCCLGARLSKTKPLAGLAPRLFSRDIPAVVAMQYPIYDDSAITFSREFYRKLCSRRDFGLLDVAVTHARSSIRVNHRNDLDFATPVLFMNTASGAIFDIDETPDEKDSAVEDGSKTSPHVSTISYAAGDSTSPIAILNLLIKSLFVTAVRAIKVFQNLGSAIYGRLMLVGDQPRLQAVSVAREQNLGRIRKEEELETDPAKRARLAEVRVTEEEKLARVHKRLDEAAKISLRVAAVILVLSVVVYVAAFFGIFNLFWIEDVLQQRAESLSGRAAKVFGDDKIRLIALKLTHEIEGSPVDYERGRLQQARLIDALAAARAKLVVLDTYYESDDVSGGDDELALAIMRASRSGTEVIVGVNGVRENGEPAHSFPPLLEQPLQNSWGNLNVGLTELGSISWEGFRPVVRQVELGKEKRAESTDKLPAGAVAVAPSLMIETLRKSIAEDLSQPKPFFYPDEKLLKLIEPDGDVLMSIPVLDDEMSFMFDPAKEEALQPYREIIQTQSLDDPVQLGEQYRGKIVIVGYQKDQDLHRIAGGRNMYGMDIHASVLSNIFQNRYIKTLGDYNLLVVAAMASIGFLLQTELGRSLRVKVPLELKVMKKTVPIPVPLIVVTIIYFVIMYFVYTLTDYFISMTPHVAILWISYWVAGWLRNSRKRSLNLGPQQRRKILVNT